MATKTIDHKLNVDRELYDFVKNELAPGTGIEADDFFKSLLELVEEFGGKNDRLLKIRKEMQRKIDVYFREHIEHEDDFDAKDYEQHLKDIGYILPEGPDFIVETENTDPEVKNINGAQLVCPVFIDDDPKTNARFPLNAINARLRSYYKAFYGKPGDVNVIPEDNGQHVEGQYNPMRGAAVITHALDLLDKATPLAGGRKYSEVQAFELRDGEQGKELIAIFEDGSKVGLLEPEKFVGFTGGNNPPNSILLKKNGIHVQLKTVPVTELEKNVAANNKTAIYDVIIESATTAIIDLEDSACTVNAHDKTLAYRNILGLFKGDLEAAEVDTEEGGIRRLRPDLKFTAPNGSTYTLPGRALMLVRNVGIHLKTDAVTLKGEQIPETFLDLFINALAYKHDLAKGEDSLLRNSRTGSLYIVMPKLHGPAEVADAVARCEFVEKALGLEPNTIKIGIMDEEQRTSVNLKECIRAAKDRVFFINTGFLDRTGDLIHTAMEAGPVETKANIQKHPWLQAYENNNVIVGLKTLLHKVGQIGKGMWTQNRNMRDLFLTKIKQLMDGASTGWVPSHLGATIHAPHYLMVDVAQKQEEMAAANLPPVEKSKILEFPRLAHKVNEAEKRELLEGYTQSILGYVVRWINQGVGCSSVPDYHNVSLMEDLATLRIGSQWLANWLRHGLITQQEIIDTAGRMAAQVDSQNARKKGYTNLVGNLDGQAFQRALNLIIKGEEAENGYVEEELRAGRREVIKNGAKVGGDVPKWHNYGLGQAQGRAA